MNPAPEYPPNNKVYFNANVPVEVALKYATGKPVVSPRTGDNVMYSLVDGRIMFLPPHVAQQITELNPAIGETFIVTKRQFQQGRKLVTDWEVAWPVDENQMQKDLRASIQQQAQKQAGPRQSPAERTAAAQPAYVEDRRPQVTPAAPAQATPTKQDYSHAITEFLVTATKAAVVAQDQAKAQGNPIQFTSADIQGLASTLFIQAAREGWLTWRPQL